MSPECMMNAIGGSGRTTYGIRMIDLCYFHFCMFVNFFAACIEFSNRPAAISVIISVTFGLT